jgi:hypothetical protein
MKVTLREHLDTLDQNSRAGIEEIASLTKRMKKKFKDCGYEKSSRNPLLVRQYVDFIFETQDWRCTHWLPVENGELNGVWNRPFPGYRGWKTKRVLYEIDHVYPANAGGTDRLTNFQFLSANANQFVKCSLTYEDLLRRVDLSDKLKDRIRMVLDRRADLFASERWNCFVKELEQVEKDAGR